MTKVIEGTATLQITSGETGNVLVSEQWEFNSDINKVVRIEQTIDLKEDQVFP